MEVHLYALAVICNNRHILYLFQSIHHISFELS